MIVEWLPLITMACAAGLYYLILFVAMYMSERSKRPRLTRDKRKEHKRALIHRRNAELLLEQLKNHEVAMKERRHRHAQAINDFDLQLGSIVSPQRALRKAQDEFLDAVKKAEAVWEADRQVHYMGRYQSWSACGIKASEFQHVADPSSVTCPECDYLIKQAMNIH